MGDTWAMLYLQPPEQHCCLSAISKAASQKQTVIQQTPPAPRAPCASGIGCTQEQPENRQPRFQKDKCNRTHQAASGPQVDKRPDITIRALLSGMQGAFKPKYSSLNKPPASQLGWLQQQAVNMTTISSSQISTLPQVSLSVFREAKL